jgi:hypothetical protein
MKLNRLDFSRMSYLEIGQFIINFLEDFDKTGLDPKTDAEFKLLFENLKAQSPEFDAALLQVKAKAESAQLMEQDLARDRKMITLRRAVSVYEYSDIEVQKTAYKLIKLVLKTYNRIEKENFGAESLGLDNLVKELRNDKHIAAVKTLKLEEHVDNIESTNSVFKKTFSTRSSDSISDKVYDTKKLKDDIVSTYKELAEYMVVMGKRKKDSTFYADAVTAINYSRKYYSDLLAKRAGKTDKTEAPSS